jgi:hypothetical protein
MDIITLNDLSKALINRVGIPKDEAVKVAGFILDLFGFDDRIIDNILEPEDRQLFYILEAAGILTTGREEIRLHDGREWLTHYWEIKRRSILRYSKNVVRKDAAKAIYPMKNKDVQKEFMYNDLSDDVWSSRKKPVI